MLTERDMLAPPGTTPTRAFESTGDPEVFNDLAARFLGPRVTAVGH